MFSTKNSNYKKWKWYVYILELNNGMYYTGMTWNPSIRYEQHLSGLGSKFTSRYGVKKLVYCCIILCCLAAELPLGNKNISYHDTLCSWHRVIHLEEHADFELARKRELQIKDFSQKKKKELIREYLKNN